MNWVGWVNWVNWVLAPRVHRTGLGHCVVQDELENPNRCVVRDANVGHQLAGGSSSWCPELQSRTTPRMRVSASPILASRLVSSTKKVRNEVPGPNNAPPMFDANVCADGVSPRID